jgi:ABC-type uncharacterized transport system involved in gliding motility auxiliary subunit
MPKGTNLDRRRQLTVAGIALAVLLFVALNVYGSLNLRSIRLDLTDNRQFTLSEGTERLLAAVEEPITLRLYASRALRDANPFLGSYADRAHDLLRAYAEASGGKIVVEHIDPQPFSPEEDRAVGFGLDPVPLEGDASVGYLGIAGTNSTDDADVLPVLSPEREPFLEYDLTRMVNNLANPDKPVVALVSGLPVDGDPAMQYRPWQVVAELRQFSDVRTEGGDIDRFADDVDAVVLVHPQALGEKTVYAVDQFVMRGGKVLAFVDPHAEAQAMRQQPGMPSDTFSDLEKLLPAWGVDYDPNVVVGDPQAARQVAFPSNGREQVVDYLPWLSLDRNHLAGGEVVTAELNRVNLGTAGALAAREGASTTFTPLLRSSGEAMAIPADKVRLYPDPFALIRDFEPGGKELVLAARVSGPLKSAFGDQPPQDVAPAEPAAHLAEAKAPAQIVVIADTDLLDDRNWLSMVGQGVAIPLADNANLVANALDYLVGSEALTSLRGREVTLRPFTKVAEIRRASEAQYRAKEQELLQRLGDLQGKLSSLRVADGEDPSLLSEAQRREIDGFRSQLLETRRELRDVQLALRQDIEGLRDRTRFLNIAAVPLLVAAAAILIALFRRARYRRRFDQAAAA